MHTSGETTEATRSRRYGARRAGPLVLCALSCVASFTLWILFAPRVLPEPLSHATFLLDDMRDFGGEQQLNPLYVRGEPATCELLILGDSRVNAGLMRSTFEQAGWDTTILWVGGARTVDLLQAATCLEARKLVLALSPMGLYRESDRISNSRAVRHRLGLRLSAAVDDRLDRRMWYLKRSWLRLLETGSWTRSWLPRTDPHRSDMRTRLALRRSTFRARRRGLVEVAQRLAALAASGWQVVCVRMPVSPSLAAIEDELFPPEQFARACKSAGVAYFDHHADSGYATTDGSHMTAASGRRFTPVLLAELQRHWRSSHANN